MSVAETEVVWSKYWEDQVAAHAAKHVDNEGIFFITDADEAMEKAIVALEEINPTEKPGEWDDDAKAAKISGRWEAMYAPHMAKLSSPFGVRFGPVRYTMGSDGDKRTITSNVQYRSKLFGSGWLNAAGTYCSLDPSTVRIDFENFWWDPTERATPSDAPAPDAGGLVQTLGTAGFLPSFSRFPVRYVSDDLCIFEFKLTGTNIVAEVFSEACPASAPFFGYMGAAAALIFASE
ncbi:hypothetical protein T484DRAFT_1786603 [Baffinella frigidus]|nr:hypothetical protein T484DRAFT_1786603 [Cryptophyta sp. CCMP2293]